MKINYLDDYVAVDVIGRDRVKEIINEMYPDGAPDPCTHKEALRLGRRVNQEAAKVLKSRGVSNARIAFRLRCSEWLVERMLR